MKYNFELLKFSHNSNGNITILFTSSLTDEILFFDGGGFKKMKENQQVINLFNSEIYEFKNGYDGHVINEIKETEDFDYIILIDEKVYLKIFYMVNEKYENGVIQTFTVYYPSDVFYQEIQEIFNESEEILIF